MNINSNMTKLSLDDEPPPKFRGQREVSKKKDRTLNQLIVSLKDEKGKNKLINHTKDSPKKVKSSLQKYLLDISYINANENLLEDKTTATSGIINFTRTIDKNQRDAIQEFNYFQKRLTESTERNFQLLYEIVYPYSFTNSQTFTKEDNKKENYYLESKEQEEKEEIYNLHAFEGEEEREGNIIKWNTRVFN